MIQVKNVSIKCSYYYQTKDRSIFLIPGFTCLTSFGDKEKGKEKKEVRTHDQEPPASSHLQVVAYDPKNNVRQVPLISLLIVLVYKRKG